MLDLNLLMMRTLWQSTSALRCGRCGAAIRLNDRFGVNERICSGCVRGLRSEPPLRKAA